MNKSEQLIACLEGEIAKRDEELAACRVAVENCEVFRARIAELEAWKAEEIQVMSPLMDYARGACTGQLGCSLADWLVQDHKQLRAELAAIKAQGVVQWPEADEIMQMVFEEGQPADDASGYCFELEEFDLFIERLMSEVARLNAAPVSEAKAQGVVLTDEELCSIRNQVACNEVRLDDDSRTICVKHGRALEAAVLARITAAPAAPAADAGDIVLNASAQEILSQCIGAHAYVLGVLANGRPDLAFIEAKKWVDAFKKAATHMEPSHD